MTWIQCLMCRQIPCICAHTVQPPYHQWTSGWVTGIPAPAPTISDDDVKRIARELAEYLKLAGLIVKALPANEAADIEADKAVAAIPRRRRKLTRKR